MQKMIMRVNQGKFIHHYSEQGRESGGGDNYKERGEERDRDRDLCKSFSEGKDCTGAT
jgi:hypothetical protein